MRGAVSVGAGGGLLAAVRSGRVCSLWAAGSSVRRCVGAVGVGLLLAGGAGGRGDLLRRRGAGGVIDRAGPSLIRTDPAGDPVQRAGSRASGGKMGKRKRPGQTARRALLLWPLVCTGGNGSGGVRPGAGGGADLLAVPVGMVSAGTVPAVGVPASRLALAVLHPGRFWTFAGGVRFST